MPARILTALAVTAALCAFTATPALADSSGVDPALKRTALVHLHDLQRFNACTEKQECIDLATITLGSAGRVMTQATALVKAGAFCAPQLRAYARTILASTKAWNRFGANPTVATRTAAVQADLRTAPKLIALVKAC